jgi:hypothetical protein
MLLATAPSREQIFESINQSVADRGDNSGLLVVLGAIVGLALVAVLINQWLKSRPAAATPATAPARIRGAAPEPRIALAPDRPAPPQRPAKPTPPPNPAKLIKAIARDLELSQEEMRKLKRLAARREVKNPLTLLLCPSLLSAPQPKSEADRPAA